MGSSERRQMLLRLSGELWDAVEVARGDVPRNTFVVRALEVAVGFDRVEAASPSDSEVGLAGQKYGVPPVDSPSGSSRPVISESRLRAMGRMGGKS